MSKVLSIFLLCSAVLLGSCSDSISGKPPTVFDDLVAYQSNNPMEPVLYECVRALNQKQVCNLATLPWLYEQYPGGVDRSAVLSRLMVSAPWMGDNFVAFLDALDPDAETVLLQMFAAVTAIVIDDSIKPSYLSIDTGVIYLDPDMFWLSQQELDSLPSRTDFRADFGSALSFVSVWAYQDSSANRVFPVPKTAPRSVAEMTPGLLSLLFHELAHSNDLFNPSLTAGLEPTWKPFQVANYLYQQQLLPSQQLALNFPLDPDSPWQGLADVLYRGYLPTLEQRAYTAAEVGAFLAADVANDDYNYSNSFEDLAMLVEEAFMLEFLDLRREVTYLTPIAPNARFCDDYRVDWAMLHRVAEPAVFLRAQYAAWQLAPSVDLSGLPAVFPSGMLLPTGGDWCAGPATGTRLIGNSIQQPTQALHVHGMTRHGAGINFSAIKFPAMRAESVQAGSATQN